MNRPRKPENTPLPDNLYRQNKAGTVYYSYRDPRTGKQHGLGTDQSEAEKDARAINAVIYSAIRTAKLAALYAPESDTPKFSRVIARHLELCETKRKLKPNTMRTKLCCSRAWEAAIGSDTLIGNVTVRDIVETLSEYEDRPRMQQVMRSAAMDIWKDAIQEGWADDNIPEKTRSTSVEVMRSRLTLDCFLKIHAVALTLKDKWIARSMELALVSTQRREDIGAMEFRQSKDSTAWVEDDALCVIQQKTGNRVRIPLDVGLNGWTVGGVVKLCRDNIISKWLVHHQRPRTMSKPGDAVHINTITKGFARCRDIAGVTGEEGKQPPTFHEIRSLSIRLYTEAFGAEFAQAIAGHKDASMTAVYRDVRGSEWVQVKA